MSFLAKRKKLFGDLAICIFILLFFIFDAFSFVERRLQDSLYQKPGFTNPDIIVIGIDEKSLAELGSFQQWGRETMANAIKILNSSEDYKPAVIAIDILYTEKGLDEEADKILAETVAESGNVVLASYVDLYNDMTLNKAVREYKKPYFHGEYNISYGAVNAIIDNDNVIRNALLKIPYEDGIIYSFPYEVYKKYTGYEDSEFLNSNDSLFITYYGTPGEYYGTQGLGWSFSDIFEEDFDPEYLADCIVLIGPYAGALGDAYDTPVSRINDSTNESVQMYGVEIHANTIQTLIEQNYKAPLSPKLNLSLLLAVMAIAMVLAKLLDIRLLLISFIIMSAGYIFLALRLFGGGYILMLIYPIFTLAIIYIYRLISGYILEILEKQKVKSAFKKYVDPKLVDKLMESGEANSNEVGVKKHIAVLFVDVRGFTPMTETLKDHPEMVVKILNEYLELTSNSVFQNGGSVDKFIGDATMALFNGFVPLDDYIFKAVKSAWDMLQGAAAVNASLKEKYNVDVGFGIGINCGEAIVGNLGPPFRKDYTAIGDTVNTAARLESNAKGSEILISKQVYDIVKDRIKAISVGEIALKGKNIKIEVFSVTDIL